MIVTTANDLAGYKITRQLGVVRGITVRSNSFGGDISANFQAMFGGKINAYVSLAEKAREEAYEMLIEHAKQCGANAIIAMRYDANEISSGITEVLAYGTAVVVEPVSVS